MSDLAEQSHASSRPLYIFWVVLLIVGFTVVQGALLAGIYLFTFGMPTFAELTSTDVPVYAQSTLWNGRVVYPVMALGASAKRRSGNLISFDPEKGDSREHPVTIPIPKTGLIADGDVLWCVSPTTIVRVEGDESVEITPKHSLQKPCRPFLYEKQLAVIDWVASETVLLRTFDGEDWVDRGRIEIPTFLTRTVDGTNQLVANFANEATSASQAGRFSPLEIKVIGHGDQYHVFVSDGVNVTYRAGIEFLQASAVGPENVPDVAVLTSWEDVCQLAPRGGGLTKSAWVASLVAGEPIVMTAASAGKTPFGNSTLTVLRRSEGKWAEKSEMSMPSLIDLFAFTDGEQTYVAGQPLMPHLRFHKLVNDELQPTGALLKAPTPATTPRIEWISKCMQWVYWPLLVVFALAVSRLMAVYTTPQYQFGAQTVELASFTRRMIARLIDHSLFVAPTYFIIKAFGFSSREHFEDNMDRFFDFEAGSMLVRYILMMSSMLALAVFQLVLNSVLQGWWGVTLGKWICGIRTRRATLRRCGFLRAMLRELFLVVDTFLGVTAIPATLAIALTNGRQRLGDLVADTIVIRTRRADPEAELATTSKSAET